LWRGQTERQLAQLEQRAGPADVVVVGAGYAGIELATSVAERLQGRARMKVITAGGVSAAAVKLAASVMLALAEACRTCSKSQRSMTCHRQRHTERAGENCHRPRMWAHAGFPITERFPRALKHSMPDQCMPDQAATSWTAAQPGSGRPRGVRWRRRAWRSSPTRWSPASSAPPARSSSWPRRRAPPSRVPPGRR
jgi:hypothetical protein